jgi:hypothetical protein
VLPQVAAEAAFLCTSASQRIKKPTATIPPWNNIDDQTAGVIAETAEVLAPRLSSGFQAGNYQ